LNESFKRVVIVDDDAGEAEECARWIKEHFGDALTTELHPSPVAARRTLRARRPEDILCFVVDLNFWGLSETEGLELVREVWREAPAIVWSRWGDSRVEQQALEAGAVAFVQKGEPGGQTKLLTRLEELRDTRASGYDWGIERVNPKYYDMLQAGVDVMDWVAQENPTGLRLLELGTGTGTQAAQLISRLIKKGIALDYLGVDRDGAMLKGARRKFDALAAKAGANGVRDLATTELREWDAALLLSKPLRPCHAVLANLFFHYLTAEETRRFLSWTFGRLTEGGHLVVGDRFVAEHQEWENRYERAREERDKNLGWARRWCFYLQPDTMGQRPVRLSTLQKWCQDAGFCDLTTIWTWHYYSVFVARRIGRL